MVSGLSPETSMVSWREAREPIRVAGGGGGVGRARRLPGSRGDRGLGLESPRGWRGGVG